MSFSNEEKNQQLAVFLKDQRTKQNITLEEISIKTGVPEHHLKAIESGVFNNFDAFYLKMYIKKYATVLDLNADEVFETYVNTQAMQVTSKKTRVKLKQTNQSAKKKPILFAAIILIVVVGVSLGTTMQSKNPNVIPSVDANQPVIDNPNSEDLLSTKEEDVNLEPDKTDDSKPTEDDVITPESETETEQDEVIKPKTEVILDSVNNSQSRFNITTEANTVKLKLTFSEDCWLAITESGKNLVNATVYGKGDVVELDLTTDKSEILLNIGNINAVELRIDEEKVQSEQTIPHQYLTLNLNLNN